MCTHSGLYRFVGGKKKKKGLLDRTKEGVETIEISNAAQALKPQITLMHAWPLFAAKC